MWSRLRLVNFKAYRDTGELRLAPLTILIGPNSGGKSSILKALLVLRQTAECRDWQIPLLTDGPYCSLGQYADFVHGGDRKEQVVFSLSWDPAELRTTIARDPGGQWRTIGPAKEIANSFSVTWALKGSNLVVDRMSYTYPDGRTLISLERKEKGAYLPSSDVAQQWNPAKSKDYRPWRFFQLSSALFRGDRGGFATWSPMRAAESALERQIANTWYLGPLRHDPRRTYQVSAERPSDVGLKGERAIDAFYVTSHSRATSPNVEVLRTWLEQVGLASNITLDRLKASFHSLVVGDRLGYRANVVDAGFGFSQVFPILMEALYAPSGSTLLLEQPEIHLNPSVQAGLADIFVDLVKRTGKQFIVETHSEHLISRIRTAIGRGDIDASEVLVYYCSLGERGGEARLLPISDLGEFESWPDGFFEEEITEALARAHAVLARGGKHDLGS